MTRTESPAADRKQPERIEGFDDLVSAACAEPEPTKLLVVLVGVQQVHERQPDGSTAPVENQGSLTPMMVRDLPITSDLSFEAVVEAADATRQPWQFLMLAVMPGRNGQAPSSEECDVHLKRMAKAILTGGNLSRYMFLERDGTPIFIESPYV